MVINTHQRSCEVDSDGNPPLELPSSDPTGTSQGRREAGDEGRPPLIIVTEYGDCGVEGDSNRPPSPDPGISDGERIRIELRMDGVTVVSSRETRL